MKVEIWNLSDVKPYDNNPRVNDQAVDAVARSIQEYGFRQPIVVDRNGTIVSGHARFKAALKLGLETVPVHVAENLTPEQIAAYRIADNKTAELSGWDYELLPIELGKLQQCDYDPADLRQLAELLQGMSEYAVSRKLGTSRRQVANGVARLRKRFEDADLRNYL